MSGYSGGSATDQDSVVLSSPNTTQWLDTLKLPKLQGRARFTGTTDLVIEADFGFDFQQISSAGLVGLLPNGAPPEAGVIMTVEVSSSSLPWTTVSTANIFNARRWGTTVIAHFPAILCRYLRITVSNVLSAGFCDVLRLWASATYVDMDAIDFDFTYDVQRNRGLQQSDGIASYDVYSPVARVLRANRTDLTREQAMGYEQHLMAAALESVRNGDAMIAMTVASPDDEEIYDTTLYGTFTQLPQVRADGQGSYGLSFEFTELPPPN